MSLLWTKVGSAQDEDWSFSEEPHDKHSLHPAFEAAGIRHSPCAFTRCSDGDDEHADAFDEAERRHFNGEGEPFRADLSQPVHGFEPTADMHALMAYTHFPQGDRVKRRPTWFKYKGDYHIMDGHHRTAAALRRGDSHLDVKLIDLDKDGWH